MHSKRQIQRVPCNNRSSHLLLAGWVIAHCFFSYCDHCWKVTLRVDSRFLYLTGGSLPCVQPHTVRAVGSSAAIWGQRSWGGQHAVLRLECAGWLWGDGVSLWLWKLAEVHAVSSQGLWEIFWWLLPVAHLRLRYRLSSSWASANWCASEVMYSEWCVYIFSTSSETLCSTSSNFVLPNVSSQHIVQRNYVAKSMPLPDFVQYFNPWVIQSFRLLWKYWSGATDWKQKHYKVYIGESNGITVSNQLLIMAYLLIPSIESIWIYI